MDLSRARVLYVEFVFFMLLTAMGALSEEKDHDNCPKIVNLRSEISRWPSRIPQQSKISPAVKFFPHHNATGSN
ncbi:unnamed protein product [Dovyalis caffra]|uniref:Uncharacterized protein n=1 Tax=Dovyalis caffra TaxID=77055 RepID=A0AAV1QQ00_9ROSI|nr:unnamed protein product [Dovyalis caffra]